ncbi:hypothetical protein GCM10010466_29380 [Planomonospora alba]|uniref:Gp28/Gp37-like domain-containing protein n=1 Tax=Planomonospora alba TaxID=161354 RepID=A0ABP6N4Z8_9ACTN
MVWTEGLDEPVMSGPVTSIEHVWDADNGGAGTVTFSGVSDEQILFGRTTYPIPGESIYNQTIDAAVGRGPVGKVITDLVNLNAGPGARGNRRVPGLVVEPSTLGQTVSWYSRLDNLGYKIKDLALANGVGWQVRQTTAGEIEFSVYTPRDFSASVLFSKEAGNLGGFSYKLTAPTATRFIAAAQGEGKWRYMRAYRDDGNGPELDPNEESGVYTVPESEWFTYWPELLIDRRDIPIAYNDLRHPVNPETGSETGDFEPLDDAVAEDALEAAPIAALSLTPFDLPTLKFGKHYRLGDTVSAVVNGAMITDVLREVRLSDGEEGARVTPLVGSSYASETPSIYREIKRVWNSLRKLEARR